MDDFKIEELCPENIKCAQYECTKKHPRCFAGLCIKGLQEDKEGGECGIDGCKLQHFDEEKFNNASEAGTMLGVYKHNICKNKNCKYQANCRFLHPVWINQYCLEYLLNNKCKNNCTNHKKWIQVKEQIQKQYSSMNLKPEQLCIKQLCQCDKHLNNAENICIEYFKGICPNIYCNKSHLVLEDYVADRLRKIAEPTLNPCIKVNSIIYQNSIIGSEQTQFQIDQMELKRLKKAIKSQNIIYVIFIMDCTKSMDAWIDTIHKQIANLIKSFKEKIQGQTIRMAFIAY